MRVVVLCGEPDEASKDPESAVSVLNDLGCEVLLGQLDCGALDEEALLAHRPNLVLVDCGEELLRGRHALKALSNYEPLADVPVLFAIAVPRLSALDFSSGFHDFVLKPFVPAELYARIRQLDWKHAVFGGDEGIKVGELWIDPAAYEATHAGRPLELTHQEFELLRFLARNQGKVFTRDQLLQRVWGYAYTGGSRTVDIHVRRLRAKLGERGAALIQTVRNVGYKVQLGA